MQKVVAFPVRLQLPQGQTMYGQALLPPGKPPQAEPPLAGHLCERCLDAHAVRLVPAPWGGDMGVCGGCLENATDG